MLGSAAAALNTTWIIFHKERSVGRHRMSPGGEETVCVCHLLDGTSTPAGTAVQASMNATVK